MKILFVLSQTQLTGAEVYAVTVADALIDLGHEVVIVSDQWHKPTKARLISLAISKRRWAQRWRNIKVLRELQKTEEFDLIHAHSRAASWVCHWLGFLEKIPYVSTVHGRQHVHRSSQLFSVYGQKILCVCENIAQSLQQHLGISADKMKVLRNPVTIPGLPGLSKDQKQRVSFLGRTTGPKGRRTLCFLKEKARFILQKHPDLILQVGGGDFKDFGGEFQILKEQLQKEFGERFIVFGELTHLFEVISQSSVLVGSGRIAIEGLLLQKPVVAVGEYEVLGLVTPNNWQKALSSNFGDVGVDAMEGSFDLEFLSAEIEIALGSQAPMKSLEREIQKEFALKEHVSHLLEVYKSTRFKFYQPRFIPVLMYHKVVRQEIPSRHRIFISVHQLRKHFRLIKWLGYTTIHFEDLFNFREGMIKPHHFPKKPVLLTFDDGYQNNFENLLPLLQDYQQKAVIYVLANPQLTTNEWDHQTGEPIEKLMTLEERAKGLHSGWIEFGSHGLTHRSLVTLNESEIQFEIVESRKRLEDETQKKIYSFAYPYGHLNEIAKAITRRNYPFGVATDHGGLHMEEDLYEIFRIPIFPQDGYRQFFRKVRSQYRKYFLKTRGR